MLLKILIASPIRQKPQILKEFLYGLQNLEKKSLQLDYAFIDDNESHESSKALRDFATENSITTIIEAYSDDIYTCNENTHHWNDDLIWKVAAFKNKLLQIAKEQEYEYIFLVDSDLILHPKTLTHLVSLNKDIVSEVFWTAWAEGMQPLPQVWMLDQYEFVEERIIELEQKQQKIIEFLEMLKRPGVYKVGGLGACTLISKHVLQKGVNFKKIYNISLIGEDRHFCVRAVASGFELFADTHYPPLHIYRESELSRAEDYKKKNFGISNKEVVLSNYTPKLTLAMTVRNEADGLLREVLQSARHYIDNAVILDDCSNDDTVAVCRQVLEGIPLKLEINEESMFHNEVRLRKKLWNLVLETQPDWILFLDADEIFEQRALAELRNLLYTPDVEAYLFRLYDFWDTEHYREDAYWQTHMVYRHFMIKYNPHFTYKWLEQNIHCGRLPANVTELQYALSDLRIKHFGWATPKDRLAKYKRYRKHDPGAKFGIEAQYQSILDPKPNLIKWIEK